MRKTRELLAETRGLLGREQFLTRQVRDLIMELDEAHRNEATEYENRISVLERKLREERSQNHRT